MSLEDLEDKVLAGLDKIDVEKIRREAIADCQDAGIDGVLKQAKEVRGIVQDLPREIR